MNLRRLVLGVLFLSGSNCLAWCADPMLYKGLSWAACDEPGIPDFAQFVDGDLRRYIFVGKVVHRKPNTSMKCGSRAVDCGDGWELKLSISKPVQLPSDRTKFAHIFCPREICDGIGTGDGVGVAAVASGADHLRSNRVSLVYEALNPSSITVGRGNPRINWWQAKRARNPSEFRSHMRALQHLIFQARSDLAHLRAARSAATRYEILLRLGRLDWRNENFDAVTGFMLEQIGIVSSASEQRQVLDKLYSYYRVSDVTDGTVRTRVLDAILGAQRVDERRAVFEEAINVAWRRGRWDDYYPILLRRFLTDSTAIEALERANDRHRRAAVQ